MRYFLLLCLYFACVLLSCGESRTSASADSQSLSEMLAELDALPVPEGVNRADWIELKAALAVALKSSGKSRFVSALPPPSKSTVTDLQVTGDATSATFTWTYRNVGDYDQNSEVNINDLTPLGANLGKTSASPDWMKAQVADGDSNGAVTISDITPLGASLQNSIHFYDLQYSADGSEGSYTSAFAASFEDSAIPAGGGKRLFSRMLIDPLPGWYRVAPELDTAVGAPSNAVQLGAPTPNNWTHVFRDASYAGCTALSDGTLFTCGTYLVDSGDPYRGIVVRYSNTGSVVWAKMFDIPLEAGYEKSDIYLNDISVTPAGTLWCVGTRDLTDEGSHWADDIRRDALLLEFDYDGNLLGQHRYAVTDPAQNGTELHAVNGASAGSMFLAGAYRFDTPAVNDERFDGWVMHLSTGLAVAYDKVYETVELSGFADIGSNTTQTFVAGHWNTYGTFDGEYLVVALDGDGNLLAQNAFGIDSPPERLSRVIPDPAGGAWIGGFHHYLPVHQFYARIDDDLNLGSSWLRYGQPGVIASADGGGLVALMMDSNFDFTWSLIDSAGTPGATLTMDDVSVTANSALEIEDGVYAFCGKTHGSPVPWASGTPEPAADYPTKAAEYSVNPVTEFDPGGVMNDTGGSFVVLNGSISDAPVQSGSFNDAIASVTTMLGP